MTIKITYTSIDGVRKARTFKTINAARAFAHDWVGPHHDVEGGHYAVSDDGVGKITWSGITRRELFGDSEPAINKVTTFYAKRVSDDHYHLFCREAGYTHDHEHQLFARAIEARDDITGDHVDGWRLRHVDALQLFDEDQKFATKEAAFAHAKQAKLEYLAYSEQEAEAMKHEPYWM
jgi:hypothetical protein